MCRSSASLELRALQHEYRIRGQLVAAIRADDGDLREGGLRRHQRTVTEVHLQGPLRQCARCPNLGDVKLCRPRFTARSFEEALQGAHEGVGLFGILESNDVMGAIWRGLEHG